MLPEHRTARYRPPALGTPACSHRLRTGCGSPDRRSVCQRRIRAINADSDHPAAPSACVCPECACDRHVDARLGLPRGMLLLVRPDALPRKQISQGFFSNSRRLSLFAIIASTAAFTHLSSPPGLSRSVWFTPGKSMITRLSSANLLALAI